MRLPRRPRIGSMGELLVEFVATEKDGHNRRALPYVGPFPSGAPGIFIDQAARLGAAAIFAGAVGGDAFGEVLLDRLRGVGVSDALIARVSGVPTGSAFVSYNSDGSRDFVFNISQSAAAHFPRGEAAIAALLEFGLDIFHISGSTLGDRGMAEAALVICRGLHGKGVRISFDPNMRKELLGEPSYLATVHELLAMSAFFLPSDADAEVLFRGESFGAFAGRLLRKGAEYVVLKRGEKGCMGLSRDGETVEVSAHRVEVVDPTGAGDCFCGTFVTTIAAGLPFADALRYANAAGALAVTRLGPMEGNSDFSDLELLLARSA